MAGWQSVYALDCKSGLGRLNSYPGLQDINNLMRDSYSGNTLAFQANADSSILLSRSKIWILSSVVEQRPYKAKVSGSTPLGSTKVIRSIAQSG